MRKTCILNNLNHKPQTHARVCDENEENKERRTVHAIFCTQKGPTLIDNYKSR